MIYQQNVVLIQNCTGSSTEFCNGFWQRMTFYSNAVLNMTTCAVFAKENRKNWNIYAGIVIVMDFGMKSRHGFMKMAIIY